MIKDERNARCRARRSRRGKRAKPSDRVGCRARHRRRRAVSTASHQNAGADIPGGACQFRRELRLEIRIAAQANPVDPILVGIDQRCIGRFGGFAREHEKRVPAEQRAACHAEDPGRVGRGLRVGAGDGYSRIAPRVAFGARDDRWRAARVEMHDGAPVPVELAPQPPHRCRGVFLRMAIDAHDNQKRRKRVGARKAIANLALIPRGQPVMAPQPVTIGKKRDRRPGHCRLSGQARALARVPESFNTMSPTPSGFGASAPT